MNGKNKVSEKKLELQLQNFVTDRGGAAIKMPTNETNGLPDQLILWPWGEAEFVELKSTGGKQTTIQRLVSAELSQMGFRCTVIDSKEKLERWQNLNHARINRR